LFFKDKILKGVLTSIVLGVKKLSLRQNKSYMSKIYGFGNALIDIEIQVNEDQLASIGILKGGMKHIAEEEKKYLLKKYKGAIRTLNPGGSIANSLHAAHFHGAKTCFSCCLGDDEHGKLFQNSYKNKHMLEFQISDKPTGVCLVFITPDGERTMASNLSANYDLSKKCINLKFLQESDYLLLDNFSLATNSGNKTANYCLNHISQKTKVCFGLADANLIIDNLDVLQELSKINIFCISGNKKEHEVLEANLALIFENRLITYGSKGARINKTKIKAPKIDLVNTNGAGDSLLGAFIALEDELGRKKALERAVNYSSKICSINGPRLI
tara:strand:- start:20282 stop:21265 length:984 start_codon:yes stop_codon:yes gene_type:complete